jgi:hypothetical protein
VISSLRPRMKLESSLQFAILKKTPVDLNPSESQPTACCGRGLKDALPANFDRASRKSQRFRLMTGSLKRLRMQRTCKEMEILRSLGPSQDCEETRPGSSMPLCLAVPRMQTDF